MEGKDRNNRLLPSVIKVIAPLHRWLYRTSGGRVGGNWANDRMPVLLLTTTGRRSGKERTWPVGYMRDGDAYAVVASNGGLHSHPAWYHKLTAEARGDRGERLAAGGAGRHGRGGRARPALGQYREALPQLRQVPGGGYARIAGALRPTP